MTKLIVDKCLECGETIRPGSLISFILTTGDCLVAIHSTCPAIATKQLEFINKMLEKLPPPSEEVKAVLAEMEKANNHLVRVINDTEKVVR